MVANLKGVGFPCGAPAGQSEQNVSPALPPREVWLLGEGTAGVEVQGRRPRDRGALGPLLPGFSKVCLQESLIFLFEKGKEKGASDRTRTCSP